MSLRLDIKNLDKVLAEVKAYPQDIDKIINNEFKAFGQQVQTDAQRLAPVNEGLLRENIRAEATNLQVIIAANQFYSAYLEFGTKSFAEKYVSSLPKEWQDLANEHRGGASGSFKDFVVKIQRWVRLKGIASGKDIDQVAYLIARKIIITGIKPHPFLFPSFMKNKIELIRNLKAQLNAK